MSDADRTLPAKTPSLMGLPAAGVRKGQDGQKPDGPRVLSAEERKSLNEVEKPAEAEKAEAPKSEPAPAPPPPATYTVQEGDTLTGIAEQALGDGGRWTDLYEANRDTVADPNVIEIGQVLKLPGAPPAPAAPAPAPPASPPGAAPAAAPPSPQANRDAWFISQYGSPSNPNEDVPGIENGNCGPTSLTMVAKAFGAINPDAAGADAAIEKSRELMGDGMDETQGTSLDGIARGARAYGMDAEVRWDTNVDTLQAELGKGRLPIVHGAAYNDDGSTNSGTGHYYVVTEIKDGQAYLNDPAHAAGPRVVSVDQLMANISDRGTYGMISIAPPPKPEPKPEPAKPKAEEPKPDPNALPKDFPFTADDVAQRLGLPADKVQANLPGIAQAIDEAGIKDKNAVIGMLATIATEVPNFEPIPEYASGEEYEGRSDLGNTQPGDGVRYKGRGYIQLTGRANYESYGQKLGVDLVGNPDLALDPKIGAKVLVQYFQDRGLVEKGAAGDWEGVRRGVNGGTNGWDTFIGAVQKLS